MSKKAQVKSVKVITEDTIFESWVVSAHDAVVQGINLSMLDQFDERFSEASGEDNPRYNASAHFMFGSRAKASGVSLRKKGERRDQLEHRMMQEEEANGAESALMRNLSLNLKKGEAERDSAEFLHHMDVMIYNSVLQGAHIWNDGKVTQDHGEKWFEKVCDYISDRKVLSAVVDKSADIAAARASLLKG